MPQNTVTVGTLGTEATISEPRALLQWENLKQYSRTENRQGTNLPESYKTLVTAKHIQQLELMKRKEVRDFLRSRGVNIRAGSGHPTRGVLLALLPLSDGDSTQSSGRNMTPRMLCEGKRVKGHLMRMYSYKEEK